VQCPSGERAISGGVLTDSGHTGMTLIADGPLDSTGTTANTESGDVARYWYSAIDNATGANESFTHYAVCSASSDATLAAQPFTVAAAYSSGGSATLPAYGGALVHCPAGTRAIGGGFGSSTLSGLHRGVANQPLAAGADLTGTNSGETAVDWLADIENDDESATAPMKVFAVCSPTSQAIVQTASFFAGTTDARGPACPNSGRSTGGGFGATSSTDYGRWLSTAPASSSGDPTLADGDIPHGWYGRVDGSAYPATYRVYALCEPGPSSASTSAPTGQRAAALAKCKKKHSKKARRKCRRKARRLPVGFQSSERRRR